jgi:hypothetical protein
LSKKSLKKILLPSAARDFSVICKKFLDTGEKIVYNRIVEYYLFPKG